MTNYLKVCGMRDADNIRAVEQLGVDWMGFIFYPHSPRYVVDCPDYLPTTSKRVGVFVDEPLDTLLLRVKHYDLNYIQLHGVESPDFCKALQDHGVEVIKALPVENEHDIHKAEEYEGCCSFLLFDTKTPAHGGSGERFDWSLVVGYQGVTPFLLSGGIGPEDAVRLKQFQHDRLAGYDLNSRFEVSPGLKSVEAIAKFIDELNNSKY